MEPKSWGNSRRDAIDVYNLRSGKPNKFMVPKYATCQVAFVESESTMTWWIKCNK